MESTRVTQAVILAAGERRGFETPVALLEISGNTVIGRTIAQLRDARIEKIVVVTGFQAEAFQALESSDVRLVRSDRYKWTGTMHSLALARDHVDGDFLLIEGDLIVEGRGLDRLLQSPARDCLLIASESGSGDSAFVELRDDKVFRISKDIHQLSKLDGEFIGVSKISYETYRDMLGYYSESLNPYLNYEYAMLAVSDKHPLSYVRVDDMVWSEIDTPEHYRTLKYIIYPKLERREKQYLDAKVCDVFRSAMGDRYEIVAPVEKLGGMNNNNFKITTNQGEFVIRLPGTGTSVDRLQEKLNSELAYSIGLDCEIVYFDLASGLKITRYIRGAETLTVASAKREINMELIASALKRLHTCGRLLHRDFDPFANISDFERDVNRNPSLFFGDYREVKAELMMMKEELNQLGLDRVPCHLDAWPENFVRGEDGIYLIDWEYSGNYDPLWDVVSIGLECEYSAEEEELFLNKYFGREPSEIELRKMDILRVLMDLHWSMWALAKVACGETGLYEYSRMRYERGKANLEKSRRSLSPAI